MKKTLYDVDFKNKKVLVRVDFNVPIKDGKITDANRIYAALPTINYLLDQNAKLILLSHLGRVKEEADKAKKTLRPVAEKLEEVLGRKVIFVPATRGEEVEKAIANLKDGEILMLENTRFEDLDGKKESKNNEELGKYWASLGDVYVNDAFGTAHRAHASNVGIASNIAESCVGFLIEKELKYIGGALSNPSRPFVAILGGAKVSDKIGVIENLLNIVDKIIIGGGMTFTFDKAKGYKIGKSLLEEEKVEFAKELMQKAKEKNVELILPVDYVVTKEFSNDAPSRVVAVNEIADDEMGLDIGPKSLEVIREALKDAKTVIWNGPVGVFEFSNFAKGTNEICQILADLDDATVIIGGGDSAAAVISMGYEKKFTHISTGGGASLEYMEGKVLPGIDAVQNKKCGCSC